MGGLRITDVRAYPTSFPVAPKDSVTLGIGRAVKRDAVIVKVSTEDGVTGWGEAHHGRCPGAVAHLVNTTMKQLVVGQDANDITGVWKKVYDKQLASHGMGAGACLALSGIDMALWDIRGKALKLPLYKLLGGSSKPIPAYAGGVSLGYQDPNTLIAEARPHVEAGYKAVKLRIGDSVARDVERMAGVAAELPASAGQRPAAAANGAGKWRMHGRSSYLEYDARRCSSSPRSRRAAVRTSSSCTARSAISGNGIRLPRRWRRGSARMP